MATQCSVTSEVDYGYSELWGIRGGLWLLRARAVGHSVQLPKFIVLSLDCFFSNDH